MYVRISTSNHCCTRRGRIAETTRRFDDRVPPRPRSSFGRSNGSSLGRRCSLLVHRRLTPFGEEYIQPPTPAVESGRVGSFFGADLLNDSERAPVDDVDHTRSTNRNVQAINRRAIPDCIGLACDGYSPEHFVRGQIQNDDDAGVAGDERPIALSVEIEAVRTGWQRLDARYLLKGVGGQ